MKRKITSFLMLSATLLFMSELKAQYFPSNGLIEYYSFSNTLEGSQGSELIAETSNFSTGCFNDENGAHTILISQNKLKTTDSIANYPIGNNDFTISFWLKLNENTTASIFNYTGYDGDIISDNLYSSALAYDNNQLILAKAEMGVFTELTASFNYATYGGNWHHISLMHISSNNSNFIYIDGVFKANPTLSFNTLQNETSTLRIGQSPGGVHFGNFEIDEFLIYKRLMGTDEIANLALQRANLNEKDAVKFNIYPNPASEQVTISNIEVGSIVSLIDLSGKMISQTIANSSSLNIPTSDFNAGVYFVRVMSENGAVGVERLVVE